MAKLEFRQEIQARTANEHCPLKISRFAGDNSACSSSSLWGRIHPLLPSLMLATKDNYARRVFDFEFRRGCLDRDVSVMRFNRAKELGCARVSQVSVPNARQVRRSDRAMPIRLRLFFALDRHYVFAFETPKTSEPWKATHFRSDAGKRQRAAAARA
jgi:hypothetical protein